MKKILIRATNWLGDAVMSLPAIRAVRHRFPEAEIAVLARPWVADLYARETSVSRMIPYPGPGEWRAKWATARALRSEHFHCAILLQNAFEAAVVANVARIPERIGYDRDGRALLLTQAVPVPKPGEIPRHERFYYLELLRRAGLIERIEDYAGAIQLEGARQAAEAGAAAFARLGVPLPVVGVSPGAAYGNAKRWIPSHFVEAASIVAAREQASVAVFGSPAERDLCESVASGMPNARNFAGRTTLAEFIDFAAACRVYLTNDSGAMHVASALGVPTVAVFGATDDTTTGPTGENSRVVREPVDCSPCLLRECPIDHRCMTRVPAGRVAQVGLDLLK
ncbi:MAG: lipopolysaccharide heptosyltransferase II [Bryobacteraceae bacterium]